MLSTQKRLALPAAGRPDAFPSWHGLSLPARLLRLASPAAGLAFFLLALWALHHSSLGTYSYAQIAEALGDLPGIRVAAAVLLTLAGYLVLIGYDLLAFRYIRRRASLGSTARASLVANALSFNLGNTALTGAALRYWLYGALGLSGGQIARVALFCSVGFWLGYFFLISLLFTLVPIKLPAEISLADGIARPLGVAFLAALVLYLGLAATGRPLRLGPWHFALPSPALTLGQIGVASADLGLMAAVLYALLPPGGKLSFLRFLPLFLAALIGGTVSQVPGGLGVFETVMAILLAPWFEGDDLAAALIAFRGIYYLMPLSLAVAFLGGRLGLGQRARLPEWFHRQGCRLAAAGVVALAFFYGLYRILCPLHPPVDLPGPQALAAVGPLVENSVQTYGRLALRGDKALLLSQAGDAFLMYGRAGRGWIAMGDPLGSEAGVPDVAWRLRCLAARAGGWCAFFEVRENRRPLYARMGLALTPVGDEARVFLPEFRLDGRHFKSLRNTRSRLARDGCRFEILQPSAVAAALPALKRVSDAWLAARRTREKGFSTAPFEGAYLARLPVAVVRRGDEILAFANLWPGAGREELSFDLMRHLPDAPRGTMDFLFMELLLWGQREGYRWFNFGLAPLAGVPERLDEHPVWARVADFLYRHCDRFYGFDGLRRYKDKFRPVWTPLYLASPGGPALGPVVVDLAALLSGGVSGTFFKRPARR